LNLVAKPAIDAVLLSQLAGLCRNDGNTLTGLLLDAQMADSMRSRRWTTALVEFALADAGLTATALVQAAKFRTDLGFDA
jgi:toluene monooxygenase system protein E